MKCVIILVLASGFFATVLVAASGELLTSSNDLSKENSTQRIPSKIWLLVSTMIPTSVILVKFWQLRKFNKVKKSLLKNHNVTLRHHCIGKGRFGKVWLGGSNGEKVAVKLFNTWDKATWSREVEIYQSGLTRRHHGNILVLVTSGVVKNQPYLVSEYHERGSLYDYLQTAVLDHKSLLVICISISKGLLYLHTGFAGLWSKPAMAHRNIKSKNILVKKNGQCAIADFGLVARLSRKTEGVDIGPEAGGTPRYAAPEILNGILNKKSFEAFKMADVYSVGLVFWEACRRCATTGGEVEPYAVPYHDVVGKDPSIEEMRLVVCKRDIRPSVPNRWKNDQILCGVSKLIIKCWHSNPDVRLTSDRIGELMANLNVESSSESLNSSW